METSQNNVRPGLGNEQPIASKIVRPSSDKKMTAPSVNVRIRAAGRPREDAREKAGDSARVQPVDGQAGRKAAAERIRPLSSEDRDRRRVGDLEAEIQWGVSRSPFSVKRPGRDKRERQPLGAVLLSVGAAIILGTIMGFSVISLFFSDDPVTSSRSIDSHLERTPSQMEHDQYPGGEEKAVIPLAKLDAVLLQAGSFSEKRRAQQTIQYHRSKGYAAVMTDVSPHRIFLGVGRNRDDALKLSAIYQKNQVDVYLKELSVPGDRVRLSRETAEAVKRELPGFVEDGHRIFQTLAEPTAAFLGGAASSDFSGQSGLSEIHRRMVAAGTRLEKQLPAEARPHLQDMMMAADQAVQGALEAGQHPSAPLMWQIQEGLVRYVLAYEALVSTFK